VLTIAYSVLAVFFLLQGLAGVFEITNQGYFYFVAIVIGAFNSVLPPTFIGIMGYWFPKKNRGLIVGFWATCNNFGNIVGIQIAAGLMSAFGDHWEYLMITISVAVALATLVIFFFLVPDPADAGVIVDEYTEKLAIIDSVVTDKKIKKLVKQASSAELKEHIRLSETFK